tara:strand:- start:44 stop:1108 length:1065 start_codon:yes stop_codon:yes gene_type:complete
MADDPNDSYAVDIWEGVDDANQENLTRSPSEWLTKISNDMRLAFAEFSKLGITPSALFSGNISLRSLLSNAFGLASGAARDAALADARDKFGPAVTDEGLVFDEVTGDAAFAVENGSLELSSVPNINATPDAISAAEAGAVLETFKIATPIMLALKNGSVESFVPSATNLFMLGNRINAINEAKENLELDLIDNPDLDTSLGSSFVSTTSTQNVTFPSPNGDSIKKALTTPTQIEKIRKAGAPTPNIFPQGNSLKPVNFTETFITPSNSITLKKIPSVITSVTGRGEGIVAGETVTLEFPLSPSALQSPNIVIKKRDTFSISGKTVTISQDIKKYDTVIIRYKFHSSYDANIKA